ncbi:hypothetical protein MVEG_09083 [Podila verticillata NRRL 6337]|nr:hypothetical protein MVEG_09083 [Podila verticillata NRRL 6337]
MKRMEFRSSEAPMDWEREQDRNIPSIFDAPKESNPSHTAPTRSISAFDASTAGDVRREFSFSSVQSGNNSGRLQSPGWDSSTPKPFRQDSQLSAGEPAFSSPSTLQRQGSFSPGISPRPLSPARSSSPLFRSGSDEGPKSDSVKPSGLFDMGSLTTDISNKSFKSSATRKLPSNQISSLRYRTSNMESDDEEQGDIIQEGDSSMSEDNNSHSQRLALRKSNSRQRHRGQHNKFSRQSSVRGENLHDPYYRHQHQPPQSASGTQARAWAENVDLPYILSGYVQVFMNTAIVGFLLYIIFNFITTIQSDVSAKMENMVISEKAKIAKCASDYASTNCATPILRTVVLCEELMLCMNRSEPRIGRASVFAETIAQIVNAFVHTISYKTMLFVIVLVLGGLYMTNQALTSYRSNHIVQHQHIISPAHPASNDQNYNGSNSDLNNNRFSRSGSNLGNERIGGPGSSLLTAGRSNSQSLMAMNRNE